jgi:hypothetical protein
MSAALSTRTNKAVYKNPKSKKPEHVTVDVKKAKLVWIAQLKAIH